MFFYIISELFWQCCIFLHVSVQAPESELSGAQVFASVLGFYCMISELFWNFYIFLHDFRTVLTVWYFSTWFRNCSDSVVFPTWFRNCSDSVVFFYMISELVTVLYFSACVCTSPGKWTVMYLCVRSIGVCLSSRILLHDFGMFWQFDIFGHAFGQHGIFRNDFRTVLTMLYFSKWFRNCSDSVVFPTWFLNCSDSVVFPTWFLNYSESVVFLYMISELFWQCSISYMISELFLQCSISYTVSELF